MKTIEPVPRMPRPKLWLYLTLLAISLILAIVSLAQGIINDERKDNTLISLMVTLFIISAVELIP
ncbi:MAG: hypothetical protein ACK5TO_05665, partial [Planctomycetaceae bacterium]